MGAIKLPVTAIKWGLYVGNDMDDEEAWIGDFVDEDMASEAATALNERPALIAERDGLANRVAALEDALKRIRDMQNGPDRGSDAWLVGWASDLAAAALLTGGK